MAKDWKMWTDEDIKTLLEMRAEGYPYKMIAKTLCRSVDAVGQKCRELMLKEKMVEK